MSFLEDVRAAREILSLGSELVSLLLSIGRACREERYNDAARIAAEYAAGRAGWRAAKQAGGAKMKIVSLPSTGWKRTEALGEIVTIMSVSNGVAHVQGDGFRAFIALRHLRAV